MWKLAKFLRLPLRFRFYHRHHHGNKKHHDKHDHHQQKQDGRHDHAKPLPPVRRTSGSEDDNTVRLEESSQSDMGGSCTSLLLSASLVDIDVPAVMRSKPEADKMRFPDGAEVPQIPETLPTVPATTVKPSCKKKPSKTVTFSDVHVREYELILGDNPYCKYPLGLGWHYRTVRSCPVPQYETARQDRLVQKAHDRIEPRLYVPPAGLGDPGHEAVAVECDHYLPLHTEQDFNDTPLHRCTELDLQERRTRLRCYGYSEAALRQAERQRKVALAQEYAMGDRDRAPAMDVTNKSAQSPVTIKAAGASPSVPFPYSPKFIQRYYH